jgi:N-acetylglucosaminyldiphosphoundecaprenol N-acetyl-beta-D-mannosaminyltransferase
MSAVPQIRSAKVEQHKSLRLLETSRIAIGRALIDVCSFQQAQAAVLAHATNRSASACVLTPNAQHVVLLDQDRHFREIYDSAALVVPDGASLLLAAHLLGRSLKERVAGVDLFESLCAGAAAASLKVFFLGGRPGSAALAAILLRRRYPGLTVETYCPPLGFETDLAELSRVDAMIRRFEPNIVFVGLGAPKQEYWMYDHGRKLGTNVLIGVGGSFELVTGIVKRAPRWLQAIGFEWLHRLCMEPRRLWRRYLIGNVQFLKIILQQRLSKSSPLVLSVFICVHLWPFLFLT